MNFFYRINITAGKEKDDPEILMMPLSYGIIRKVQVVIPDGQKETCHLQIFYHEAQLYPLNRGENYRGDGYSIDFEEFQPILVEPYELKAKGWSDSTEHPHAFLMAFTVLLPEEIGFPIPDKSVQHMKELIGFEGVVTP